MRHSIVILALLFCILNTAAQTPEQILEKLQLKLPTIGTPIASYIHCVRSGNILFLSGKGPQLENGTYITGKLGKDLSIEKGSEAAKLVALAHLAVLKKELGDLSKVKRVIKVSGFVNSTDEFTEQPKVLNGYSDLMVTLFGEKGKHARSAIGVNALPLNFAVEVEVIVEVE
jgi:enamine deaminase RidA (YjgF/YER057c/UK114 family)